MLIHYCIIFLIGYIIAFLGTALPGILNMTAGKIAHEYNSSASEKFILGACVISIFYCFIATQFSFYIQTHPDFVAALYKVGAVIFGILTIYYIWKAFISQKEESINPERNNFFLTGMFLTFLNILPIPFYTGISILISEYGYFSFYKSEIALLLLSVGLGTYSVLKLYAIFYKKVSHQTKKKSEFKQKRFNANHLIACITLAITLLAIYRINF